MKRTENVDVNCELIEWIVNRSKIFKWNWDNVRVEVTFVKRSLGKFLTTEVGISWRISKRKTIVRSRNDISCSDWRQQWVSLKTTWVREYVRVCVHICISTRMLYYVYAYRLLCMAADVRVSAFLIGNSYLVSSLFYCETYITHIKETMNRLDTFLHLSILWIYIEVHISSNRKYCIHIDTWISVNFRDEFSIVKLTMQEVYFIIT